LRRVRASGETAAAAPIAADPARSAQSVLEKPRAPTIVLDRQPPNRGPS
jgi:hypothetical protein